MEIATFDSYGMGAPLHVRACSLDQLLANPVTECGTCTVVVLVTKK